MDLINTFNEFIGMPISRNNLNEMNQIIDKTKQIKKDKHRLLYMHDSRVTSIGMGSGISYASDYYNWDNTPTTGGNIYVKGVTYSHGVSGSTATIDVAGNSYVDVQAGVAGLINLSPKTNVEVKKKDHDQKVTLELLQVDWDKAIYDPITGNITIPKAPIIDPEIEKRKRLMEFIKGKVKSNMQGPLIISDKDALPLKVLGPELKARDTLRDLITEAQWRKYLVHGFITVQGSSSFIEQKSLIQGPFLYKITPHKNIEVYKDNKVIHGLCIHTHSSCPPTDHVINMKVLVELDEQSIWSGSNIRSIYTPTRKSIAKQPSLKEVFKKYKNTDWSNSYSVNGQYYFAS